ncbi:type II toxin-antitoxin system HicB family antitoxin [bacterium]|nr:type II toxin-antitoxin system HicB family antitoxin [bacterium]MBU0899259.1 type II toxin-antitoxin system HicB family antitoxin [bacterium]MBU1154008.1 type II toxin-antitoxin system HicB family antitoxin [bacterium]MBU1782642.1 type II toxin-antitoxin system HicB family antitoxin [bacterium]MBU2599393.1 type II toxin-antitoxin system HicB family antitoxin [bacterium]
MKKHLTGLIKKFGDHYVSLCLELNVSSQGESIEEAKRMLEEACEEYLSYMNDEGLQDQMKSVPLEILHEFLVEDVDVIRPSQDWTYSESLSFEVLANA